MPLTREQLRGLTAGQATAFDLVERAAIAGGRCPQNEPFGPLPGRTMARLAYAGLLEVEIFAHNFRRVTIRTGAWAGARTAAPPNAALQPYRTIKAAGSFGKFGAAPSPPRRIAP